MVPESPKHRHPLSNELYTPITPEILALFARLYDEYRTWRAVAEAVETKTRVIRRVRSSTRSAISMTLLDRVIQKSGIGDLRDYTWFTAEDMIALGLWKPVKPWGSKGEHDEDDERA